MNFKLDILSFFRGRKSEPQDWWVEATTIRPACTYYFGPYAKKSEANLSRHGFIEDLKSEDAVGIRTKVKPMQPQQLTIVHNDPFS